jgi:hypothetical protein
MFYPLGCMAGYKLDDDISAYAQFEQNVMFFFQYCVLTVETISVSHSSERSSNTNRLFDMLTIQRFIQYINEPNIF